MKLRLQSNSIRLRLKRTEVTQLAQTGRVEEKIIMGSEPVDIFHYVLESSPTASTLTAHLKNNSVLVQLPTETVLRWATSAEVGIEAFLPVGSETRLQVLIEKDFACLDRPDEENVDTFPHPLAGAKC
jgi:hypothetical protein